MLAVGDVSGAQIQRYIHDIPSLYPTVCRLHDFTWERVWTSAFFLPSYSFFPKSGTCICTMNHQESSIFVKRQEITEKSVYIIAYPSLLQFQRYIHDISSLLLTLCRLHGLDVITVWILSFFLPIYLFFRSRELVYLYHDMQYPRCQSRHKVI